MTQSNQKTELPPTACITGKCRGSYVTVFKPKKNDNDVDVYSVQVLLAKTDKATQLKIKKCIEAAIQRGLDENTWKSKTVPEDLRRPIRDGDKELASGKKKEKDRELYEGNLFFNATAYRQPAIVDRNGQEIIKAADVYSGAFYRFELNFYPYFNKGNAGISAGLNAVQKVADGTRLGGGGSSGENFGDYQDDDEDDTVF